MKEKPEILLVDPWLEPFGDMIRRRREAIFLKAEALTGESMDLGSFANGHLYFGAHKDAGEWIFREWAPNATELYLTGSFNNWQTLPAFRFKRVGNHNWELRLQENEITHKDLYKIRIRWKEGEADRIPAWAFRVVQDPVSLIFNAQIWDPPELYSWANPVFVPEEGPPLIYEAHVGMATEEPKVGTYKEFRERILPRVKDAGYNTLQLMAIQEHPYYGSFGYHVSSFFAPSSRFGEPEELKRLIDEAHGMGIRVIMDLVHSHAVKNELEGLGNYDGSGDLFFHSGERREHVAWDSLCFNYGKTGVIHFLLSNIKYWLEEFRFDGFRFDGITSMLFLDHGLNRDFTSYDMYFDGGQDEEAITYLGLANMLLHKVNPSGLSIAEEMSGYPGLGAKLEDGGLGFDYRMAMGTPDYWIRIIKEKKDEEWDMEEMFHELTQKRAEEKTVGYSESHDQALVGDKTIIFRLIDADMYYNMNKESGNLNVDRGIALHKMIRLITASTSGDAYLNFMGNEFGHPEWIDFPREGNNWSYQYSRRQWSLVDNKDLKYHFLGDFDREMLRILSESRLLSEPMVERMHINNHDKVLAYKRKDLLFIFNFHPGRSYEGYGVPCHPGSYNPVLSTDTATFGGYERIRENAKYFSVPEKTFSPLHMLKIYLPSRTAVVLRHIPSKRVY